MNKILYFFIIFILISGCSFNKNSKFWTNSKTVVSENIKDYKEIFPTEEALKKEFNSNLQIKLTAKLVNDMYYDSCYLYADPMHIDHQYTYIIWSGKKDRWVSCWDNWNSRNVFVLKPEKIISRYMSQDDPMDYTDFANGETRFNEISKLSDITK